MLSWVKWELTPTKQLTVTPKQINRLRAHKRPQMTDKANPRIKGRRKNKRLRKKRRRVKMKRKSKMRKKF